MNWMTVAWPMVTAACLTLAFINLRIALGDVQRAPHLYFTLAAVAVAAISGLELGILQSQDLTTCQDLLRWSSLPITLMVVSVVGFVWTFFGTGRPWLALLGLVLLVTAEVVNFFSTTPAVRGAVALTQAETIGGVRYTVPEVANGPWSYVELASVGVIIVYVVDASRRLWLEGERQRAFVVGGSIVFFFLVSRGHAVLVEEGIVRSPYFVSFAFLAVLIAMGHELGGNVFRAARLSRELFESERRMELAAQAAKLGCWTWHLGRGEMWASDTARELFQVPAREKIDLARFMGTLHPEDKDHVQRAIAQAVEDGSEYEKSYRILLPDGGQRWIAARGKVETDASGRPVRMRGVLMDVTEQKTADAELNLLRQQLAHVGRVSMMGQLASALAHELNQPLGAILRNAEAAELFLTAAEPDMEEVRAIISDIRKDDERAGQVISRLRSLLKRQDIETRPLAVPQLLEEVVALTRADAVARGVQVETDAPADLPLINGDRVHLQQVLLNLIINALDAFHGVTRPEKRVRVSASHEDGQRVALIVEDNANGIPDTALNAIFDPFFTTKAHGMGMGLPISKTIIEAHGGTIAAASSEAGGAVFIIRLPSVTEES